MALPLIPPCNLSFSAVRLAEQCERRAALAGPGAWQAWPGGARAHDPIAALCYRGKNLHALLPFLGQVIHTVAERVVREAARSGRRPTFAEVHEEVVVQLRTLWLRPRRAFESSPKLGMLFSKYFRRVESEGVIRTVKERAAEAVRRLLRAPLLDDLAELERGDRIRTEELLQMAVERKGLPPATFFGKADVVYTHRRALVLDGGIIAPGPYGIPVIADFKTGRVKMAEAKLQLSLLALLLRANGLEPHPVAGYVGRIIDLSPDGADEDLLVSIGARELEVAASWIREGHARIAAFPRNAEGHVELSSVAASHGPQCASCPMQRACVAVDGDAGTVADVA